MPEQLAQVMRLTLYDPETDEVKQTYSRAFVPWRILKAAVRIEKKVNLDDAESIGEEDLNQIADLVVEAFGNKFSVQDLDDGCDVEDVLSVVRTIIARAHGLMANPTPPPKS